MKSLGILNLIDGDEKYENAIITMCNGMLKDLLIGGIVSPCNATCAASGYSRAECMKNMEEKVVLK